MGLKDTYSPAELASLAPEELAALETAAGDETGLIAELAAGSDEAAAAEAAKAAAGEKTPEQLAAEAAAAKPAPTAEEAAAAAAAEAAKTPEAAATTQPDPLVYRANVGDVAKEVGTQKDAIKAARGEKRAALMKLNDGEIDADEYAKIEDAAEAKIDAANDRILELNRAATRVEVATELTTQQQTRTWQAMLGEYKVEAKKAGLDYDADEAKRGEFNGLVKAFAMEAANSGKSDDNGMEASRWALDQAKQVMQMRHGKAAPAATTTTTTTPAATTTTPTPAAALNGLTTLAKMPAAAAAPVADDVMARIGTLEGEDLELFMAKLSPADYARVVASAQ